MLLYVFVWFGRNSEAEFNRVNESLSKVGIELLGQLKKLPQGAPRTNGQHIQGGQGDQEDKPGGPASSFHLTKHSLSMIVLIT